MQVVRIMDSIDVESKPECSTSDEDYVSIFDHLYTNNHIQILKSLLPFMETSDTLYLPILIKYMELKYTISLLQHSRKNTTSNEIRIAQKSNPNESKFNSNMNLNEIYKIIHKYLAPNEDKAFSNILNTMQTIKNFQEMQSLMESFRKLNSDNDSHSNPDLNNILNFISENNSSSNNNNINIEELMQLFSMFNQ